MGDTQSTPVEPEGHESETSLEKPWSPHDVSASSDEEATAQQNETTSRAELEPPSSQAQKLAKSKPQRQRANKFESARKRRSNSNVGDHTGAETEDTINSPVANVHSLDDSQVRPDSSSLNMLTEPEAIPIVVESDRNKAQLMNHDQVLNEAAMDVDKNSTGGTKSPSFVSKTARSRVPCPEANAYDCKLTFSSKQAAKRHAGVHLNQNSYECLVCAKTYNLPERLKKHQLTHRKDEIDAANQQNQAEHEAMNSVDDVEVIGRERQSSVLSEFRPRLPPGLPQDRDSHPQTMSMNNAIFGMNQSDGQPQASISLTSGVKNLVETDIVQETPQPLSRLKRKREVVNGDRPLAPSSGGSRKRRRRQSLSPSISVHSDEDHEMRARPKINVVNKLNASKKKSQNAGNLDDFAKPWTPGSKLRHPIHDPKSPRPMSAQSVQVVIPRTSKAGSSTKRVESWRQSIQNPSNDTNELTPLMRKQQRMEYTSPKGKRKADDNIEYSSPPGRQGAEVQTDEDEDGSYEPEGMATTFAKRTVAKKPSKQREASQSTPHSLRTSTNTASHVREGTGSDSGKGSDASQDQSYVCQECGRRFKTRNSLRRHEKQPHLRSITHECNDCGERFKSTEQLKTHQRAAGHGDGTGQQGRKGAFSDGEVRKLHRWRDNFCEQYDISMSTFNQMMTDSSRRSKGFQWPYRFIAKAAFLEEYYDTLPDRNRRSMHRYRERAFQNVPEKQEWTEEDDEELLRLVREIGPKWVEIGQMMTRTQDSVNQRWRHRLQYKGKAHQGEWIASEEQQLKTIVAEVRGGSGMPLDSNADVRIPWDTVSKRMDGRRTAQQCSNKWRLMHQVREGNRFFNPTDIDRKIGLPSSMATPSKMSQRLAGQTPSTTKSRTASQKKFSSTQYVHESDEEDSPTDNKDRTAESMPNQEPEITSSSGHQEEIKNTPASKDDQDDSEIEDQRESAAKSHKPLPSRTPRRGASLSQAFAQTQANTSALRAPTTTRRLHTQTEMPTPGIPMQLRPSSSPLRMISVSDRERDLPRVSSQDEDAVMAEPQSSDEESSVDASGNVIDEEASEVSYSESSNSDGNQESETNDERKAAPSATSSSSSTSVADSTSSEAEESDDDDDGMIADTQKDSFVQSLRPPGIDDRSSLSSANLASSMAPTGKRRVSSKIDWNKVVHGINEDESTTDSDSSDEGDIMHH